MKLYKGDYEAIYVVYYESIMRELKRRPMCEYRCDGKKKKKKEKKVRSARV